VERLILGRSPRIVALRHEILSLARQRIRCVLVLGETGVGKDLVPRALHAHAPQLPGPLVVFNCPAVPIDHLESELFGTTRGAYPGAVDRPGAAERAGQGLLVLDEIGAMQPRHQAKLLRLLENREGQRLGAPAPYRVEASFAASTNEDLAAAVRTGRLREDLYYRLAQDAVVLVPPLRERLEDVPLLAQAALDEVGAFVLTPGALAALESHAWPGNVRELRAVVRSAARLARDGDGPAPIHADHVLESLGRLRLDPTGLA
jgi:transcriptional regulator with PAS, ATPase and Fis domain